MTIEDRVALLENQVQEIFDVLEQIAKDLELTEANITRVLKGLRPETARAANQEKKELAVVVEETFLILKFEPQQGAKIGDYEVAYAPNNIPDKFNHAHNILRNSNATINDRYHGQGYQFSYWLYGEGKIYRQKMKPKA